MRSLITLLLISLASTCYAGFDFTGSYQCKGYDPYLKKNYTGVVIIKQQNAVYKLTMAYNTGEEANGTGGLFDADTIAVVFQDTKDLKKVGLERYELATDGKTIQGYWVYLGGDQLAVNTAKRWNSDQGLPGLLNENDLQ